MKSSDVAYASNGARLLEVPEVARLFRKCDTTIKRWAKSGKLPAIKVGSSWQFNEQEILRLMRSTTAEWGDSLC